MKPKTIKELQQDVERLESDVRQFTCPHPKKLIKFKQDMKKYHTIVEYCSLCGKTINEYILEYNQKKNRNYNSELAKKLKKHKKRQLKKEMKRLKALCNEFNVLDISEETNVIM